MTGDVEWSDMPGIRAELVFESPESCPVAVTSQEVAGPLTDISWTGGTDESVSEQFTASNEGEFEGEAFEETDEFEEVFDYGPRAVYEFERERDKNCICDYVERSVGPVTETYAVDGDLHVTLHAAEMGDLREHIREFKDRFGQVRIEYLVRGRDETDESDLVPIDVRRLTDRQREVLETAHEMGYFEYPRGANASEVAAALDIEPSTFTEHLNAAQSKILDELQLPT